jgi:hypothetical protein
MIETQFAMNCDEGCNDSHLRLRHRGSSRPFDAAARSAHHRSITFPFGFGDHGDLSPLISCPR